MELSAYLAVSLDGFIARADGSMDWLRGGGPRPVAEAERHRAFMQRVDAVAMGRATFEAVRHRPVWPYGTTPVVVLGNTALDVPDTLTSTVEHMHGMPAAGSGRPLFGSLPAEQWLDHVATTADPGGLVQSEYLVRRSGS